MARRRPGNLLTPFVACVAACSLSVTAPAAATVTVTAAAPAAAAAAATTTAATAAATGAATAAATGAATAAAAAFTFKAFGFGIFDLPRASYPYARDAPIARVDTQPHDATGVRMALVNGRLYDHPVAQASYGLVNLESYRVSRDAFYLDRARKQADRLIRGARVAGGAWYLPYHFSFDLHGLPSERVFQPWYSAMAQGQALSLFVRLAETTGEARYRTAAAAVFATFLRPRGSATPWTVWVDHGGYLWLEEYAGPRPDRTFNGQMFAAWGLWDYWRLTGDAQARHLWDGALSTVRAYAPTIRNPGWISSYCLSHQWSMAQTYHLIHVTQLASLYGMSHNPAFATFAESFQADFPTPGVRGTVRFAAGRYPAYRFDSAGRITGRTAITLTRTSSAPADQRTRISGRSGYWYRVTAGALRGYDVQEQPGRVTLLGSYLSISWTPARAARLAGGRAAIGYTFDAAGRVTGSRRVTPATATGFSVSRTAHWNAVRYALAADGPLAGFWVPVASVTFA